MIGGIYSPEKLSFHVFSYKSIIERLLEKRTLLLCVVGTGLSESFRI